MKGVLFIFVFLFFICPSIWAYKILSESEKKYSFEKAVAHVLKTESRETGNPFVVLFHSLNEKDENLNALIREVNTNDIALTTFSGSDSIRLWVLNLRVWIRCWWFNLQQATSSTKEFYTILSGIR